MKTRDGQNVVILDPQKSGMSVYKVFGTLNGNLCHWTAGGKYRMDDKDDPRDIVNYEG